MKSRLVTVLLVLGLTGCSMLTKNGRQQHAYERYVRKSSITRAKSASKVKFRAAQSQVRVSEPKINAGTMETPESVTQTPTDTSSGTAPAQTSDSAPPPVPQP